MVQEPLELSILEMKKFALLDKLEGQIVDKTIMGEIKQLVGANFSLKNIFGKALGISVLVKSSEIDKLRKRLALKSPDVLATFDELIRVSQEYDKKNKFGVVF